MGLLIGSKPFVFDALGYWQLPEEFMSGGSWSFGAFDSGLRGYVPALLYGALRALAGLPHVSVFHVVLLSNAFVFSLLATVLVPRVASAMWPGHEAGHRERALALALLLLFWAGYLVYPLTDFPAAAAAFAAIALVHRRPSLPVLAAAGFFAGIAVNLRPAYIAFAAMIVVVVVILRRTSRVRSIIAVVLGAAIVSVPQSLLMQEAFGTLSPVPGAPAHLTSFQLTVGLQLQRYETFVGAGRSPRMSYLDPANVDIERFVGSDGLLNGYPGYFNYFVHRPIAAAGSLVRHLANGVDQRYSTPYVGRLAGSTAALRRMIGWLLVALLVLRLAWRRSRDSLGRLRWTPVLLACACSLTSLPAAMETRFMLPVFLLALAVCLAPGWAAAWTGSPSSHRLVAAVVVLAVGLLIGVIADGATDNLRFG